jgi:LPXTG-site transpeptidase (sortase) family protein
MQILGYLERVTERALRIFDEIWAQKGPFFGVFFGVVLLSYAILYAIDFIPEAPDEAREGPAVTVVPRPASNATSTEPAPVARAVARYPERIIVEKIGMDVEVLNPSGSSIAELDSALLKGAVRHPESADFKNEGTMFLFGHSSYLPTVHNQNFKAFNGIQKLVWGDVIVVRSEDTEYRYRVEKVYKAEASETEVALDHSEPRLVLVTCNSFGSKDDRFVVEADLIDSRPI